jgi:WD40 repeat protein/tRNA A-37 threonylcarbamoyl transferase component Bud32
LIDGPPVIDPIRQRRLDRVLADYRAAGDTGSQPLREALVERHPDLADPLRSYFEAEDEATIGGHTRAFPEDPDPRHEPVSLAGSRFKAGATFGDYELLEEIARGGMGVVFKARQRSLNRVVALKMVLAGQLASDEEIRRFVAEAEAAANLDHPSIVPVHEIGDLEGQHYFSMGFVEGESLAAALARGPFAPRRAATTLLAIVEAVAYAHEQGVVHRDLKPGNVLIDSSGRPRLTDFGLAKRVEGTSQLTVTGQILGTPSYMSPEQASGRAEDIGPATDLYAMGALLYALLTGRPPFQAASMMETLRLVEGAEPVAPSSLQPAVPKDLETICLKCLAKNPPARYASALDLAADLRRFLAGEPIVARPVGAIERAWRWVRRNPMTSALLGALALTLVAGTLVSTLFAVRSQREAGLAREAEDLARQRAYDARSLLLQASWEQQNLPRFAELLDAQMPEPGASDLRGFEWYYWRNLLDRGNRVVGDHSRGLFSLAFSPDGERIATGSGEIRGKGEVHVWKLADSSLIDRFDFEARVNGVSFAGDGRRLAVASGFERRDGRATVIDLESREEILAARLDAMAWDVAFGPGGRSLAVATGFFGQGGSVEVFDLSSRQHRFSQALDAVAFAVELSPDGRWLAAATGDFEGPGTVKLWRTDSDWPVHELPTDASFALDVSFDPTSDRIAAAISEWRGAPGEVWVWETASGGRLPLRFDGVEQRLATVDFSPDGRHLATGSYDKTVRIWDATNGLQLNELRGHGDLPNRVRFSPDGRSVASASSDRTLRVWDPLEGQKTSTLELGSFLSRGAALSPDNRRLLIGAMAADGSGLLELREPDTGAVRWSLPTASGVSGLALDSASELLATGHLDGKLTLRNLEGEPVEPELSRLPAPAHRVRFSADGKRIAAVGGHRPSRLRVWERDLGEVVFENEGVSDVRDVVFSRDGGRLIWTSWLYLGSASIEDAAEWPGPDNPWRARLHVRDLATGEQRDLDLSNFPTSLAPSHAGELLATGNLDGSIRILRLSDGFELRTARGHDGRIMGLDFSPDDRRLASTGQDGTVRMWNTRTTQEVLVLREHTVPVTAITFGSDGGALVTTADDGTVKIWDGSRPTG